MDCLRIGIDAGTILFGIDGGDDGGFDIYMGQKAREISAGIC
jgi:hypothetical protein